MHSGGAPDPRQIRYFDHRIFFFFFSISTRIIDPSIFITFTFRPVGDRIDLILQICEQETPHRPP